MLFRSVGVQDSGVSVSSSAVQRFVGTRFRRIITGDPAGVPPWLDQVARGETGGLYSPEDAPWQVHADFATLIGGIRALLMQTLHPATLAGVAQHSRYESDAIGRLAGTTRWLTISTFACTEEVMKEAARVNAMHARVRGTYSSGAGQQVDYSATNEDLLLWVHMAFTQSFLIAHQTYSRRPIPGGADAYVSQWAKSVEPLGLHSAPTSVAQLDEAVEALYRTGVLSVGSTTLRVVAFLKKPPLSATARVGYRILFACAVVTLPERYRELLELPRYPRALVVPVGRFFLRALRKGVGPESPIEDAALARLHRI